MATVRTYTIPLRKEWLKTPKYRRAKKAIRAIKEFLIKHMKSENIKIGKFINLRIWKDGIKNPPGKIKINVSKDDEGLVKAELFGKKYVDFKPNEKVEKSKKDELMDKLGVKKAAPKADEKKEEKAEDAEKPEVSGTAKSGKKAEAPAEESKPEEKAEEPKPEEKKEEPAPAEEKPVEKKEESAPKKEAKPAEEKKE